MGRMFFHILVALGFLDPMAEPGSESELSDTLTPSPEVHIKTKRKHQTPQGHSYYVNIRQIPSELKPKEM